MHPKGKVPKITNPQICRFTKFVSFANFSLVWQFVDPFFALCRFSSCDLPTPFLLTLLPSSNPQKYSFSSYKYKLKML
jgi:hypothetical protein